MNIAGLIGNKRNAPPGIRHEIVPILNAFTRIQRANYKRQSEEDLKENAARLAKEAEAKALKKATAEATLAA